MQTYIEGMRSALQKLTAEWAWQIIASPEPGKQCLKVIARKKSQREIARTFTIDLELIENLGTEQAAGFFLCFLHSAREKLEIQCRLDPDTTAPTAIPAQPEQNAYEVLRRTYQADVRELKAQSTTLPRGPLSAPRATLWTKVQQQFFTSKSQL